jgi:hypothetical protein
MCRVCQIDLQLWLINAHLFFVLHRATTSTLALLIIRQSTALIVLIGLRISKKVTSQSWEKIETYRRLQAKFMPVCSRYSIGTSFQQAAMLVEKSPG